MASTVTDVEQVTDSATDLWQSLVASLPRVGIALVLVTMGWLIGRGVRRGIHQILQRSHPPSFATVMSKLAGWMVVATAVMLGITVVFPSVAPVDLLAGLGFFSVAVGFAFQDILENLLAGVLLLFRQPFASGDQIEVTGHIGTVESITIRETRLRTYDGQRVLVPNADVYKNAIRVQTAFPLRRIDIGVGVAYEADLAHARSTICEALANVAGVADDPPPEALLVQLGTATVDFEARFWTRSPQIEALRVRDEAIEAVKIGLDEAGIEMPADIVALQATTSFAAALKGEPVTPGGSTTTGSLPVDQ